MNDPIYYCDFSREYFLSNNIYYFPLDNFHLLFSLLEDKMFHVEPYLPK
jgi:hypothetical protein